MRAGIVYSNKEVKDNVVAVTSILTGENNKIKTAKSKIKLQSLVSDEDDSTKSTTNYSANEVLDGTSITTEIDDNNKNIVNLINNYFNFDKN